MVAGSGDAHGEAVDVALVLFLLGSVDKVIPFRYCSIAGVPGVTKTFRRMPILLSLEKAYDCTCPRPPSGPHGSVSRRL